MAKYQSNVWYLDIDGTDVSAFLVNMNLNQNVASVETTSGSGTEDIQRGVGLRDHTFGFSIYKATAGEYAITLIEPGLHTFTIGLEGNGSGKPKHVQQMVIESAPFETDVSKTMVAFTVAAVGAATPSVNMYAGGVFA